MSSRRSPDAPRAPTVHVVGAALIERQRCLVARRGQQMRHPLRWEFPGGKVEPGESPEAALAREIREELDIEVEVGDFIGAGNAADSQGRTIRLDVYRVRRLSGDLRTHEHDRVAWMAADELDNLDWAPADVPVVAAVKRALVETSPRPPAAASATQDPEARAAPAPASERTEPAPTAGTDLVATYDLGRKPRRGDRIELDVDGLSGRGAGRGVVDVLVGPQKERRRYLVEVYRAVPKDRLSAVVGRVRRRRIGARLDSLLSPSPDRVTPRCRHFGPRRAPGKGCGGCALQQMAYEAQLREKHARLVRLLERAGLEARLVRPVIGLDEPWYYRNKMEYSFGQSREGELALGLYPRGYRYEVLDLTECYLQSPASAALLPHVGDWARTTGLEWYRPPQNTGFLRTLTVREGKRTGQRMVILTTSGDPEAVTRSGRRPAETVAIDFGQAVREAARALEARLDSVVWIRQVLEKGRRTRFVERPLLGPSRLEEHLELPAGRRLRFEIHPRAFFQPNTVQAERLYAEVLRASGLRGREGGTERAGPSATVLDLYCGTGTIGLTLAPYATRVVGIELQAAAVENARRNARINGLDNVEFVVGDVGEALAQGGAGTVEAGDIDVVVVDPPRSGLRPKALEQVAAIGVKRLVYVSCNPCALARDLGSLARDFAVESVQPVDMFPHTAHLEVVVGLARPPRRG